jgi:hypothetical protein
MAGVDIDLAEDIIATQILDNIILALAAISLS